MSIEALTTGMTKEIADLFPFAWDTGTSPWPVLLGCVWKWAKPQKTQSGFADHYPYEKWLAIIGKINPTFSDKPLCLFSCRQNAHQFLRLSLEMLWVPTWIHLWVPSGEHTKSNGKSPCLMGKSTISMAIFNSFLYVHQRVYSVVNPC